MLHYQMSRVTRKPDFCLCENKGADQLRSNCEADQRLCFRYTDSTLSLLIKSEISSFYAASGTGHVGMLPPFYRTFTQNEDVITSNKCLKYNYPTKTQKAYRLEMFPRQAQTSAVNPGFALGYIFLSPSLSPFEIFFRHFLEV